MNDASKMTDDQILIKACSGSIKSMEEMSYRLKFKKELELRLARGRAAEQVVKDAQSYLIAHHTCGQLDINEAICILDKSLTAFYAAYPEGK